MIKGIGTDIVAIKRIQAVLEKQPERFVKKILSKEEAEQFYASKRQAEFMAGRFAAKEAFAKALGTGMRSGVWFNQIVVKQNSLKKPFIHCCGEALLQLENQQMQSVELSLAHERDYALAFVVLS